jgi:hypothetical protein
VSCIESKVEIIDENKNKSIMTIDLNKRADLLEIFEKKNFLDE